VPTAERSHLLVVLERVPLDLVHSDGLARVGDRVRQLRRVVVGETDGARAALPLQQLHRAPPVI